MKVFSDTYYATVKSVMGNKCAQIFSTDIEFTYNVPMAKESDAGKALQQFFEDVGVPTMLHTDNAKALTQGNWKKVRDHQGGIKQTTSEPYSQWQNRAEGSIGEVKKQCSRLQSREGSPPQLWDFMAVLVSETRIRTAHPL